MRGVAASAPPFGAANRASLPPVDRQPFLDRLREQMVRRRLDLLVVTSLVNVRYLCGFSGSAGLLVLSESDAVLVTDGRYGLQAPAEVAMGGARVRVEALAAPDQVRLLGELVGAAATAGRSRVGLEAEHVSWATQRSWATAWGRYCTLVGTVGVVEAMRQHKGPAELARVRSAASLADQALSACLAMLAERPSEAEVALALDSTMRSLGAEAPAFSTIVASGPNAAEPHHQPTRRAVERGELVVLDFGARVDGYCSDMTRTVVAGLGEGERAGGPTGELRRALEVVLASQDAGLAAVRGGVRGPEVDRACREVVGAAGLAERFVHGTGHGVGLEVHEAPALGASSQDILSPGQVVTVEPGVYLPGVGGARTEDTVVVTEHGCEVLTLSPKYRPVP